MAARSTNRFKQKPAIPFGDFMLPILGIIALLIVVLGLKILWAPNSEKLTSTAKSRATSPATTGAQGGGVAKITKKEDVGEIVVARPVQKNDEKTVESAPVVTVAENKNSAASQKNPAVSAPQNPAQKSQAAPKSSLAPNSSGASKSQAAKNTSGPKSEPKRTPAPQGAAVNAGSIDKSQFVVQCGSYSELSSANSVVVSLGKIGLPAVVRKADVRGKIYFRVIVAGGNDRAVAEEVAKKVEAAGYPVLVRAND